MEDGGQISMIVTTGPASGEIWTHDKELPKIFINPHGIVRILRGIHGHRMDKVDGWDQLVVGVGNEFKNNTNIPAFGILDTRVSDVRRKVVFRIQYICL